MRIRATGNGKETATGKLAVQINRGGGNWRCPRSGMNGMGKKKKQKMNGEKASSFFSTHTSDADGQQ